MKIARLQKFLYLSLAATLTAMAGCSGAGSSTSTGGSGSGGGSTSSGSNVAAISVNTGPTAGPPLNSPYIDGAFTSVTLCAPGARRIVRPLAAYLLILARRD